MWKLFQHSWIELKTYRIIILWDTWSWWCVSLNFWPCIYALPCKFKQFTTFLFHSDDQKKKKLFSDNSNQIIHYDKFPEICHYWNMPCILFAPNFANVVINCSFKVICWYMSLLIYYKDIHLWWNHTKDCCFCIVSSKIGSYSYTCKCGFSCWEKIAVKEKVQPC